MKKKRKNLSKMTEKQKAKRKALQSARRVKLWRDKQKAKKLQMGHKLKPRVLKPWMRKLLKSGIKHIREQQGERRIVIEEFRQYLKGQGRQGSTFLGMLEDKHNIYKTVHNTIMMVRPCASDVEGLGEE